MSRDEYNRTLGAWVRFQRQLLGVSQLALAAAIGVSPATIRAWELGRGTMLAYSRAVLVTYFQRESKRRTIALGKMPQLREVEAGISVLPPVPAATPRQGGKHAT